MYTLCNSSVLPDITFYTNACLSSFRIIEKDILAIIKSLDLNKSHGWDTISIKMINMCGESLALPLKMIFGPALNDGFFPDDWEKKVILYLLIRRTMLIKYRPIRLFPIFAKIFEMIIFTSMFEYFIGNELFTVCQSGFLPDDSCTSQLLSIIHEMQKSFDESPTIDVRGIFLNISKAFDKVWHKGFIYKLKSYAISDKLLKLIENYLIDCK